MIFSYLIIFANSSLLTVNKKIVCIQIQKTWSQSCHSFHDLKALALPNLSKRATLKAPRMCIYDSIPLISWHDNAKKKNGRNGYNTPMRRFRCFVFDLPLKLRSSRIVKTKAQDTPLLLCMCPPRLLPYRAISKAETGCKVNTNI